ncbi:MAG: hypothetical protein HEQ35_05645 [Gloeotrichia echinulata IR180]
MFGFDGSTQGLQRILEQIAENEKTEKLTHKEVRAYARCFLVLIPHLNLTKKLGQDFTVLMAALSAPQLPHYDRSFLASKLLKMLEKAQEESKSTCDENDF